MTTSVEALRDEAASCRRCDLWKLATQTVFGEGAVRASCSSVSSRATWRIERGGRSWGPQARFSARCSRKPRSARLASRLELAGRIPALVTIHPSAVLRAGDEREERRAELLKDLELARATLDELVG